MDRDWIVVLEAGSPGPSVVDPNAFERLLQAVGDGAGLYNPDRYAVQLLVVAGDPGEAMASALCRWREAIAFVGLPLWEVERAEVLTAEEFERDCLNSAEASVATLPGHPDVLRGTSRCETLEQLLRGVGEFRGHAASHAALAGRGDTGHEWRRRHDRWRPIGASGLTPGSRRWGSGRWDPRRPGGEGQAGHRPPAG